MTDHPTLDTGAIELGTASEETKGNLAPYSETVGLDIVEHITD